MHWSSVCSEALKGIRLNALKAGKFKTLQALGRERKPSIAIYVRRSREKLIIMELLDGICLHHSVSEL